MKPTEPPQWGLPAGSSTEPPQWGLPGMLPELNDPSSDFAKSAGSIAPHEAAFLQLIQAQHIHYAERIESFLRQHEQRLETSVQRALDRCLHADPDALHERRAAPAHSHSATESRGLGEKKGVLREEFEKSKHVQESMTKTNSQKLKKAPQPPMKGVVPPVPPESSLTKSQTLDSTCSSGRSAVLVTDDPYDLPDGTVESLVASTSKSQPADIQETPQTRIQQTWFVPEDGAESTTDRPNDNRNSDSTATASAVTAMESQQMPVERMMSEDTRSRHETIKMSVMNLNEKFGEAIKGARSGGLFNKKKPAMSRSVALEQIEGEEEDEVEDRNGCRVCCAALQMKANELIRRQQFDYLLAFLIISNAAIIGAQTDHAIKNLPEETPMPYRVLDLMFTMVFTMELILRLVAEGREFFSWNNRNLTWNFLDSVVVGSALLEEIFLIIASAGQLPTMQAMRLLRILRLVRVVRVIRVLRFFRDLRMMVYGIMSSLKSLIWCILLLLLIMFMFAVCVMQITAQELQANKEDPTQGVTDEADRELLVGFFGSLITCVYTLHMSIFGGVDWGEVADSLSTISPLMVILFMMYVSFSILCVLNVVTGVFVENASKITMQDEDHMIMEELNARKMWFEEVRQLFEYADADGTGEVEWHEFEEVCADLRVQMFFRKIGVDVESSGTHGLFQLLDFNGNGKVDVDEFVMGIQQLHGVARSLDMIKLQYMNKNLTKKVDDLMLQMVNLKENQPKVSNRIADVERAASKRSADASTRSTTFASDVSTDPGAAWSKKASQPSRPLPTPESSQRTTQFTSQPAILEEVDEDIEYLNSKVIGGAM